MTQAGAYKNKMDHVEPPSYLKDRVLTEVRELRSQTEEGDTCTQDERGEVRFLMPRRRRLGFAFAFIGAAAAFVLATVLNFSGLSGVQGQSQFDSGAAYSEGSFQLVAYASQPDVQYARGDNVVVFDAQGMGMSDTSGMYSGCLFNIEGIGIAQVEMSLSKGQLYGYAEQEYSHPSFFPITQTEEHMKALALIDQKLGGLHDQRTEGGRSVDMQTFAATGCRLLGSECSLVTDSAENGLDLKEVKFGFWIGPEDVASAEAFDQDLGIAWRDSLDSLDGHVLKVKVHYASGSQAEQVYILRTGKMKVEEHANGSGVTVLPEEASEDEAGVYTVYGTLAS